MHWTQLNYVVSQIVVGAIRKHWNTFPLKTLHRLIFPGHIFILSRRKNNNNNGLKLNCSLFIIIIIQRYIDGINYQKRKIIFAYKCNMVSGFSVEMYHWLNEIRIRIRIAFRKWIINNNKSEREQFEWNVICELWTHFSVFSRKWKLNRSSDQSIFAEYIQFSNNSFTLPYWRKVSGKYRKKSFASFQFYVTFYFIFKIWPQPKIHHLNLKKKWQRIAGIMVFIH